MYRRGAVMTLSPRELLQRHGIAYVATRTGKYTTKCPTCRGGYLNVKVDRKGATWFCHGCGWDGPKSRRGRDTSSDLGPIKATYDYTDENGTLLFQVLRFEPLHAPKQFRQRKGPDQKKWSIKGVRIVLLRLHELVKDLAAGRTIFVVEGEKDVITLRQHDIAATCNPMGACKWWPEFNETLKRADVVICGDNDEAGREHVMLVAAHLHGVARRLRVLDLAKFWPQIQESDDITAWFAAGGTAERLWEIVEQLSAPKDPLACIEPPEASGDEENRAEHARTSARPRLLPPPSMPMLVARSSWRIIAPLMASSRCATGAEAGGGGDHRIGGKYRTAACEACSTLSPSRRSISRKACWCHGLQPAERLAICSRRWLPSAFCPTIPISPVGLTTALVTSASLSPWLMACLTSRGANCLRIRRCISTKLRCLSTTIQTHRHRNAGTISWTSFGRASPRPLMRSVNGSVMSSAAAPICTKCSFMLVRPAAARG